MPKIVVTGSTGWLGRHVQRFLEDRGCRVIGLDRCGGSGGECTGVVPLDLLEPDGGAGGWQHALEGASAVIHCAGYAHRPVETDEEVERFDAINRRGTELVVAASQAAGVGRLVYVSSISVYEPTAAGVADEAGPVGGATAYAKSKLAGEQAVRASALDWRVARLATVFGTGDRANFWKLAQALRRRRFLVPGRGEARKSVIPVGLAARVIGELALQGDASCRLLNVALPSAPSLREVVDAFVKVCGVRRPPTLPANFLMGLGRLGDLVAGIAPSFPLTSANLRKLTSSSEVNVTRLMQVFPGWEWPAFPDALAEHREWYMQDAGR